MICMGQTLHHTDGNNSHKEHIGATECHFPCPWQGTCLWEVCPQKRVWNTLRYPNSSLKWPALESPVMGPSSVDRESYLLKRHSPFDWYGHEWKLHASCLSKWFHGSAPREFCCSTGMVMRGHLYNSVECVNQCLKIFNATCEIKVFWMKISVTLRVMNT